jgi:DNA topoisomerase I
MEVRSPTTLTEINPAPEKSAALVGLRYVSDREPGITRIQSGKNFVYHDPKGRIIRDAKLLGRINALAIPPAWTNVWICPLENGHLQATGCDDRKRKQYRYHRRWREVRDETKFNRMLLFARALPKIRRQVRNDLKLPGLSRRKVLATIVRLLEVSLIRVGNDEYARENCSYGLTTMRDHHAKVNGAVVQFRFRGKSSKYHTIGIRDPLLAKVVKKCQELPGQEIFQYIDQEGQKQDVKSEDVNEYIREISGQEFTAKDFRTWAGTVLAAMALQEFEKFDNKAQAKKNLVKAIEAVAEKLGNTPAVCKKCYVHPEIFNSYLDGTMLETMQQRAQKQLRGLHQMPPEEAAVLVLLQERIALEREPLEKKLRRSLQNIRSNKTGLRLSSHRTGLDS